MTIERERHLQMLGAGDCLALLVAAPEGRVLVSIDCLPRALPARLCVVGDVLALASAFDGFEVAARRGDVVAVEVDGTDGATSWSVHATGALRELNGLAQQVDPAWLAHAAAGAEHVAVLPLTCLRGERSS